jgi:hypothetical protein
VARIAQGTTLGLALTRRNLTQVSPPLPVPVPPVDPSTEVHFVHQFNSTPDGDLFTVPSLSADAQGSGMTIALVQDPLTQFRADSTHLVPITGLKVTGGAALPSPTRSARISSADPAPQEYIALRPSAVLHTLSVGFSLRIGPGFTPGLFITTDTVQIEASGEYVVAQLACHPTAYGLWVHTQDGVGALIPIVPEEWYWVAMLYDGPTAAGKMRVYRIRDWQYLGESVLPVVDMPVYATIYGRTDAVHVATDDFFWYGVFCGRFDTVFPIIPKEAYGIPTVLNATIDETGLTLTVVLSRASVFGDGLVLVPTGDAVTLVPLDGDGTSVHRYTISRAILRSSEETAVLDYTKPTLGDGIQTLFGTALADFTGFPVTNLSTVTAFPSSFVVSAADQQQFQGDITQPITLADPAENGIVLLKLCYYDTLNVSFDAPTFDGVAMALVHSFTSALDANFRIRIYRLAIGNKPAGTYDVFVNVTNNSFRNASWAAEIYNHVHQATPCGTPVAADGSGASASVTVASAPGDLVTGFTYGFSGAISVGPNQTPRSTTGSFRSSDQDGAASVTHSYSQVATNEVWTIMAVPLKPA